MLRSTRLRRRALLSASCLLAGALTVAGCGSGDSGEPAPAGSGGADAGAFPLSVKTKFGTATVKKVPRRVVALGWSDQDVALALGVKPVAVVKVDDGFKHGVGPWDQHALGSSRPEVLDSADGYPVEKIAALHPDLILAVQSGLTSSDYAKLSKFAPTVAYQPGHQAYGTDWQDQTELIGKALGRRRQAAKLVKDTQAGLDQDRRKYPDLAGRTFVYAYPQSANGRLVLYTDVRTKVLREVGMKLDPVVDKGSEMTTFARAISLEHLDEVTSDAMLVWYDNASAQKQFESDGVFKKLPAVRNKAYIPVDRTLAQATAAPSVLSIPWSMKQLLPELNKALGAAKN